ncbi:uncharacterized protein E5676_scaffold609G00280 [Cucumis melo var. makuwa]|uniref:Uncharacterized protein n=1 Tax=Cucumis melo var. makuwa TaxID=1194695 RepID=A0A5D3DCT8_CUCMM|nr:uncharacterized protein E5676_scaffold609G00280 [Cucumis melo var. makuwa]
MSKKKEIKEQRNLIVDIDVQDYSIKDEDEGSISVNNRATSSGSSLKKPRQKGPMDAFFTPNPETVVQNCNDPTFWTKLRSLLSTKTRPQNTQTHKGPVTIH